MEKHKPLHQIRIGSVRASIWEQRPDKGQPFLTVTVSQSYKDKSDQWQNGHSFSREHLDVLMDAILEAKEFIRTHRQSTTRAA